MRRWGSGRIRDHLAFRVAKAVLLVLAVIASVPLWLALFVVLLVMSTLRPFVTVPLGLMSLIAFALAVYLLTQGDLSGSARAVFIGCLCGGACLAFVELGDRMGSGGPDWPMPPWWWYT